MNECWRYPYWRRGSVMPQTLSISVCMLIRHFYHDPMIKVSAFALKAIWSNRMNRGILMFLGKENRDDGNTGAYSDYGWHNRLHSHRT